MDIDNNWFKPTVQDEMDKNPKLTRDMIDQMKNWLHQQPHYPPIPDMELVLFIQACDFDIDEAKKALENNYKMKTKSILFKDRSPNKEVIKKSRESVEIFVMKERDQNGNVVAGGKLFNTDISKYCPQGYFEEAIMVLEVFQLEHGTVPGLVIVIDVQGTTLRHLLKIPLSLTKALLQFAQDAITLKIKALHFINTKGSVIDTIMALIRPFLKESLLEKIHFHQGYETLNDYMNPKVLPEEYGGKGGKLKDLTRECEENLSSYKKYFTLDESRKLDESKKPQEKSKYFGWF